jgi:hypothetical protein
MILYDLGIYCGGGFGINCIRKVKSKKKLYLLFKIMEKEIRRGE